MDGILVINKPLGLSSHDCVYKIRKLFNTKKVGHSGTLDQEASGVLVLGINKGTKLLNYLNQDDKIYAFTVMFGQLTDTLDHTGTLLKEDDVVNLERLESVLASFKGAYSQVPPAYSAVKVKGKKLYEYARNNQAIPDVPARNLTIYTIDIDNHGFNNYHANEVSFIVHASKGIYVRKLALDIAEKLGTVAHTTRIHRLKAGNFTIDEAIDLDQVTPRTPLLSMQAALKDIKAIKVDKSMHFSIKNGQALAIDCHDPLIKLIDETNTLLAIYERRETKYYAKNVFM